MSASVCVCVWPRLCVCVCVRVRVGVSVSVSVLVSVCASQRVSEDTRGRAVDSEGNALDRSAGSAWRSGR